MWRPRFTNPASTALRFSFPNSSLLIPPCIFSALMVATTTATDGVNLAFLHLILKNFSAPKSAPNPASVTTYSPSFRAVFVASTVLQP